MSEEKDYRVHLKVTRTISYDIDVTAANPKEAFRQVLRDYGDKSPEERKKMTPDDMTQVWDFSVDGDDAIGAEFTEDDDNDDPWEDPV